MVDSITSQRRGSTQSDTSALVSSLTRDPSQSPSAVSTTANTRDLSPSPSCSSLHMRSEGSIASPPDTPKKDGGVSDFFHNSLCVPDHVITRNLFVKGFSRKSTQSLSSTNANEPGERDHGNEGSLQHRLGGSQGGTAFAEAE